MLTATAELRHKECYDDHLELAPVRLLGGFVNVDTHLGCVGCSFCLNRRYPVHRRVLERKIHREFAEVGASDERIISWVRGLPSVRDARVPVRIGHITDLAFEERGACEIVAGLDPQSPVLLATRFPIGEATRELLRTRRNVLLHLTVTPASPGSAEAAEGYRAIDSVRGLPADQVFVVFCPLVAGTGPAVQELLRALPSESRIGFKEVDVTAIPGCGGLTPMPRIEIDRLIARAGELGHRWMPFYGCLVRANLGLPCFFATRAAARSPETCARCANHAVCADGRRPTVEEIRAAAATIGLEPTDVRFAAGRVEIDVAEPAARADEVFLSEKLTTEVRLSAVARAEKRATIQLGVQVFRRWERVGFYPVEEMRIVGRRMAAFVGWG
jgi:hypothetical protein